MNKKKDECDRMLSKKLNNNLGIFLINFKKKI
jgi:hypothetical protein